MGAAPAQCKGVLPPRQRYRFTGSGLGGDVAAMTWTLRWMFPKRPPKSGPNNSYRLTSFDPAFHKKMAKAEDIMARYRNTLRELAK